MQNSLSRIGTYAGSVALALLAGSACKSTSTAGFETPEAALREFADTLSVMDEARLERLFGSDGLELLRPEDEGVNPEDALRVEQYIREKIVIEQRGDGACVAWIGNDAWPFPIPLRRESDAWHFDVEAGAEELENRRVGRNELSTIASLHAYVDAQREYASESRDGQPRTFASTIISSSGKHDGLYWPAVQGEPESPLGPLIAEAARAGYSIEKGRQQPFHGYYFRVLHEQGPHAPGGARSFVDGQGRMTGGFAMLAWPAKYGVSGVMTFQVHQQGLVYERDFGAKTETEVERIRAFDPDPNWTPTAD